MEDGIDVSVYGFPDAGYFFQTEGLPVVDGAKDRGKQPESLVQRHAVEAHGGCVQYPIEVDTHIVPEDFQSGDAGV